MVRSPEVVQRQNTFSAHGNDKELCDYYWFLLLKDDLVDHRPVLADGQVLAHTIIIINVLNKIVNIKLLQKESLIDRYNSSPPQIIHKNYLYTYVLHSYTSNCIHQPVRKLTICRLAKSY